MTALVGRAAELAELVAALDDARAGRGGLAFLVGEAGIGKTRLAGELARAAASGGAAVRWGRCWEGGGAPPFWPWIQLLRAGAGGAQGTQLLRTLEAGASGDEVRLSGPGTATSGGAQDRFALFDAVASCLLAEARRAPPLVLVLDDLHDADPPSLVLLKFLARALRDVPLLIVGTYRAVEARLQPEVGALLAQIAREGLRLRLRPLGEDEVGDLVRGHAGAAGAVARTHEVFRVTEGNPLFVEEVLRLLGAPVSARSAEPLPDGVRAAIAARLALLSPPARAVLEVASVLGRAFGRAVLAELAGLAPDAVDAAVTEALAAEVLAEDPDPAAGAPLSFSHALFGETLRPALSAARRVALHRAAAAALERRADATGEHASAIAHHSLEAGDLERAHAWALLAGARASRALAFEEAALLYGRVLAAQEAAPAEAGAAGRAARLRSAQLLMLMGEARTRAGEGTRGRDACRRAAESARALDEPLLLAEAALAYAAEMRFGVVDPIMVDLLRDALARLPEEPTPLRARVQARLAAAVAPSGSAEGVSLARGAIDLARRLGDRETLLFVLDRVDASGLRYTLDGVGRVAHDREALELARALGDRIVEVYVTARLVRDHLENGDAAGAAAALEEHARAAAAVPNPHYQWMVPLARSTCATMQGRFAAGAAFAEECLRVSQRAPDSFGRYAYQVLRFGLLRARADPAEIARDGPMIMADQPPGATPTAWASQAWVSAMLGKLDEARASVERHAHTLAGAYLPWMAFVAEVLALTGDRARGAELYTLLLPRADQALCIGPAVCEGSYHRTLGLLAVLCGDEAAAERHFAAGAAFNERLGALPWLARTLLHHGELVVRRGGGERPRGEALLRRAAEVAASIGLDALVARAAAAAAAGSGGDGGGGVRGGAEAAPAIAAGPALRLWRDGEYFTLAFQGNEVRLRDSKGLRYLERLLAAPDQELHVVQLAGEADAAIGGAVELGDAGAALDPRAKDAYRRRIADLEDQIAEAESFGDGARAARAQDEMDVIAEELARAVGLGGRDRRGASRTERARINVQRRIRDVVGRIQKDCPMLARYLESTVKTGTYCRYAPLAT